MIHLIACNYPVVESGPDISITSAKFCVRALEASYAVKKLGPKINRRFICYQ